MENIVERINSGRIKREHIPLFDGAKKFKCLVRIRSKDRIFVVGNEGEQTLIRAEFTKDQVNIYERTGRADFFTKQKMDEVCDSIVEKKLELLEKKPSERAVVIDKTKFSKSKEGKQSADSQRQQ